MVSRSGGEEARRERESVRVRVSSLCESTQRTQMVRWRWRGVGKLREKKRRLSCHYSYSIVFCMRYSRLRAKASVCHFSWTCSFFLLFFSRSFINTNFHEESFKSSHQWGHQGEKIAFFFLFSKILACCHEKNKKAFFIFLIFEKKF